jgi:anti-anti-sigma factor
VSIQGGILVARLKNEGEVTIISIQGSLDIEQTQPFKETCIKHFLNKKLVFNMEGASFVGSTGLKAFLDTVQMLSEESAFGLKIVGLRPEFRRILQNMEIRTLQIHESLETAVQSFVPVPDLI